MDTVSTVAGLRARIRAWRGAGERIALTPTMGALHEGHLSLVTLGCAHAQRVVATIFVNPTQFGAGEDLAAYPRDEARDAAMLERAGCDLIFAPSLEEMYPPGFSTEVRVEGLTDCLCGAVRPGHFDGRQGGKPSCSWVPSPRASGVRLRPSAARPSTASKAPARMP